MKAFLRRISPKRAVEDFATQWQQPTPHRWQILGVACAATFALFVLMIPEDQVAPPARPEVTYITTFASDRSREEIIASNLANQQRQDELDALYEERAELRRDLYRQLGRATGIDVDSIDAEAEAERAAEEAAEAEASLEANARQAEAFEQASGE